MRRRQSALAAAVVVLGLGLGTGCSDDGDSGDLCEGLADTPQLGAILNELDASDPGGTEARLEDAIDQFRDLESGAPGAIRDDLARVRQGVELVLEAVQDNPDDLAGAREQIASDIDQLSGLVAAGDAVVTYARDECGLDLVPVGVDDESTDGTAELPEDTTTTEG